MSGKWNLKTNLCLLHKERAKRLKLFLDYTLDKSFGETESNLVKLVCRQTGTDLTHFTTPADWDAIESKEFRFSLDASSTLLTSEKILHKPSFSKRHLTIHAF